MSSLALPALPVAPASSAIWPLARIEAVRYARHPLFLVGFVLAIVTSAGERGPIELDYHVIPSFFIGVLGLIVAARLTSSTNRSRPVMDASPVSQTTRTAALCLACAVPTAAGLVVVLLHHAFVLADPFADFLYGTYGPMDRFLITMVVPVIACAGGPLLGVAVGRWWRFPGATLLAVVVLLFWADLSGYVPEQSSMNASSLGARILHMVGPYTAFASGNGDGETPTTVVTTFTGSVFWYTIWTLALCGLAAAAALWWGAERETRRVLGRWFAVLGAVALVALVLSVALGNDRLIDTSQPGAVTALGAHSGG